MGPKDREERQLMRQRGAGTRQVKNIGFDLVLPGHEIAAIEPLQPIKSGKSRKTPQPELPPQRSSRRTPKPEKTQLERSTRKTPATGIAKKRGRPAKMASPKQRDNVSTSHFSSADGESNSTKNKKLGKAEREKGDPIMMAASEAQGDGIGTTEAATSAAPSTGIKKRKKRKSIGQQSTSRAKATKARSPFRPARQPRNRTTKPELAEVTEATDLGGVLANETQTGTPTEPMGLDGGEPTPLAEIAESAELLVSGVDSVGPRADKLQPGITQKPKKRKRVAVDDVPKKRSKVSSTGGASFMGHVHDEQDAAADFGKPRKGKHTKRKRATGDQEPEKRVKAGITPAYKNISARGETGTAESEPEASQRGGKPAGVKLGSGAQLSKEQEATAEANSQTQKSRSNRKKRKSISQQRPKKNSMGLATPSRTASKTAAVRLVAARDKVENKSAAKRGRPRAQQPPEQVIENPQVESLGQSSREEAIQISEARPSSKPKASRVKPKARSILGATVNEADKETSRHAPEDESGVPTPVLPEKKKRGRPRKVDAAQTISQSTKPMKIPASRKPKSKPSTIAPKPPDVLSQLCSELLSKQSSALAEQISLPDLLSSTELKRTKETTDFYAQELASRLLQLTTTLNSNTSLHSRVRAAAKEERVLKKELKRLERGTEEIRARKEEVMKERKKRKLDDLLSGIAGAVKRGWDMEKDDEEGGAAAAGAVGEADLEV